MTLTRRTRVLALALCGWTLFTWTTRVPLLLGDDDLTSGGKVLALVPVLVFVVGAVAVGLAVGRRVETAGTALVAFAAWTVAYWVVRLALIATHDHPVGFVVVHAVLGIVAGTLAVLAGRAARADGAGPAWARRSLA
ncbi:MAG TPA: hypothetical protein VGO60_00435 [Iamia sp.]|jgi:hypothetical protein|nr:hypothetical protein [Iamia sp.]